jgi:hypothetical protein
VPDVGGHGPDDGPGDRERDGLAAEGKAGVGSAVNDTTRQMGGALGVAIIGTLVASVYSSGISSVASAFGLSAAQTTAAKGSLGSALTIAADPNSGINDPAGFAQAAKVHFVDGLSTGLRVGAVIVLIAAIVAFKFLPAFAKDPLAHPEDESLADDDAAFASGDVIAPVAGD